LHIYSGWKSHYQESIPPDKVISLLATTFHQLRKL
jgi:hypothetical protein